MSFDDASATVWEGFFFLLGEKKIVSTETSFKDLAYTEVQCGEMRLVLY